MLVDKTEFEAWMERIMGELYRISRKLDKAETREKHLNYLNGERLYDNQEVCLLLRISKRTLQRYRALYTPPVKPWEPGVPEVRNREERPRVKLVTGAKS